MAGRVSDRVKRMFQEILESPTGYAKFKRIMAATTKPDVYLAYFKECADRGLGKAPQFMEMELNDISDRPSKEELDAAIQSIRDSQKRNGVEGE